MELGPVIERHVLLVLLLVEAFVRDGGDQFMKRVAGVLLEEMVINQVGVALDARPETPQVALHQFGTESGLPDQPAEEHRPVDRSPERQKDLFFFLFCKRSTHTINLRQV
jgi:hypothetical protein